MRVTQTKNNVLGQEMTVVRWIYNVYNCKFVNYNPSVVRVCVCLYYEDGRWGFSDKNWIKDLEMGVVFVGRVYINDPISGLIDDLPYVLKGSI